MVLAEFDAMVADPDGLVTISVSLDAVPPAGRAVEAKALSDARRRGGGSGLSPGAGGRAPGRIRHARFRSLTDRADACSLRQVLLRQPRLMAKPPKRCLF
jgi:hypothetical protein